MPFIRSAFNYDGDVVSYQTGSNFEFDPELEKHPSRSRTQQNAKNDCDINVIVGRFMKTGQMPDTPMPTVADFTETVTDFQSAMNIIVQSQRSFMGLPADVRAYFGNDPQKFLQFVDQHDNFHDAVRLGIAKVREQPREPDPVPVRVMSDDPPAA